MRFSELDNACPDAWVEVDCGPDTGNSTQTVVALGGLNQELTADPIGERIPGQGDGIRFQVHGLWERAALVTMFRRIADELERADSN